MPQTYKESAIAQKILDLLETQKSAFGGINAYYFGDREVIAAGKAIAVQPENKRREYQATGLITNSEIQTRIIVYVDTDQGVGHNIKTAVEISESIEDYINTQASPVSFNGDRLDGLIMDGMITEVTHGYRVPASRTMRASSLIFTSRVRTGLVE